MQAMGGQRRKQAVGCSEGTEPNICPTVTFQERSEKSKLAQDRKAGPFYTTDVQEQQAVRGSVATVSNIYLHRTAGPFYSTAAQPCLFNITLKRQAAFLCLLIGPVEPKIYPHMKNHMSC